LFLVSALLLMALAFRPPVEIHETHLAVGRHTIPWTDIRRLDRTRILLVYPGDLDSANSLLRHLRRCAREALIDGIPYRQFWGDGLGGLSEGRPLASPRYRLLRAEDEAEVERLYQRLKTVGNLHPDNPADEK
jgi:hypothetical protein